MKTRGLFITLEGTEGSGKSTQIGLLHRYLRRRGWKVLRTFEPGGTPIGLGIRRILLDRRIRMCDPTETLLYMASRAELVEHVIRPALRKGRLVISDRWLDATIAYQGYGLGVSKSWIQHVARAVTGGVRPDLTFYLDIPVREGLARARRRGKMDRIEKRPLSFHARVRRGYLALARREKRFRVIPVTTVEETHARIRGAVTRFLTRRRIGRRRRSG